jgi:transposase
MTRREELEQHSKDELIDYILALEKRIADIEARLNQPRKTARNSSLPPSRDEKPNKRREGKSGKTGKGGQGHARSLEPNPDRTVTAPANNCPSCGGHVGPEYQTLKDRYDRIEIPPVRPNVTRVHQYQGTCPGCGEQFAATPPDGLEPGSPFGRSVAELVIYLHTIHVIGFQRLVALIQDLFGLSISEGAIANILHRAKAPVDAAVADITTELRRAEVIGCDETGAWVAGRKYWQWVFGCATAVLHKVAPSRGKAVVQEVLNGHVPAVWVSDRFPAQTGHGASRQVCLAHLLRDVQYAIDAGDTVFAPPLKSFLLRAVAIGRRRDELQDSTLYQYRCRLDRDLDELVMRTPDSRAGEKLRRQIRRVRGDMLTFVTNRAVPYTNNASERYLRPAVIFRKVTQGFRADWGADFYAGVRSVVDTGRLHGVSALAAIRLVLAEEPVMRTATA